MLSELAGWLEQVAEGEPGGDNLELDDDFAALERAAQGRAEQQYGGTIIPAEEPDWKDVEAQALQLSSRTRDLRVLVLLAVARLNRGGLVGYADVLDAIRHWLEIRWVEVHPQLDPEDDNDPTLRANALLRLADPRYVLRPLRDLPLASSPRVGRVTWRDIALVDGTVDAVEGTERRSESLVRAAFAETDLVTLQGLRAAVDNAVRDVIAIGAAFDQHAGYGVGPDLDPLAKLLREILRDIDRYASMDATGAFETDTVDSIADVHAVESAGLTAVAGAAPGRASSAQTAFALSSISTRAEAVHLLGLVLGYYERFEPSSPLPILVERARRLAEMSFMEVLRDLAPDGLMQAQTIAGIQE